MLMLSTVSQSGERCQQFLQAMSFRRKLSSVSRSKTADRRRRHRQQLLNPRNSCHLFQFNIRIYIPRSFAPVVKRNANAVSDMMSSATSDRHFSKFENTSENAASNGFVRRVRRHAGTRRKRFMLYSLGGATRFTILYIVR